MRKLLFIALLILLPCAAWGQDFTATATDTFRTADLKVGPQATWTGANGARDTTDADLVNGTYLQSIFYVSGGNYYNSTSLLIFDLSSIDTSGYAGIDSARIILDGDSKGDGSLAVGFVRATVDTALVANYNNFDGWAATGAYTVTWLTDTVTAFSTGYNNVFKLTTAGLDTLRHHMGTDNLCLMMLNTEVVRNSTPTLNALYRYDGAADTNKPKLEIYCGGTAVIQNATTTDISQNSITVYWDTLGVKYALPDSYAVFLSDSTTKYWSATTDTFSVLDTLSTDTQYSFVVVGYYADNDSIYSLPTTAIYTYEDTLDGWSVTGYAADTVKFYPRNTDTSVNVALRDSTLQRWISTSTKDTTATLSYQTVAEWQASPMIYASLDSAVWRQFYAMTVNGDEVLIWDGTADSVQTTSRIDSIYTDFLSTTSLYLYISDTTGVEISYLIKNFGQALDTVSTWADVTAYNKTLTLTGLSVNSPYLFTAARNDSGGATLYYGEDYDARAILGTVVDSSTFIHSVLSNANIGDALTVPALIEILTDSSLTTDTLICYGAGWDTTGGAMAFTSFKDTLILTSGQDLYALSKRFWLRFDSLDATRAAAPETLSVYYAGLPLVWTYANNPTLDYEVVESDTARIFSIDTNSNPDSTHYCIFDSLRLAQGLTEIYVGGSAWQEYPLWQTASAWAVDTLRWFSGSEARQFVCAWAGGLTKPDSTAVKPH